MASIIKDPGGRRRIQFTDADGSRRTIRLGRCSQRDATAFRVRVEALASLHGHAPDDWSGLAERPVYNFRTDPSVN